TSLFGVPYSKFMDESRRALLAPMELSTPMGVKMYGVPTSRVNIGRALAHATAAGPAVSAPAPLTGKKEQTHRVSFESVDTGDPQMHQVIEHLKRVAASDISIVIEGETGAG